MEIENVEKLVVNLYNIYIYTLKKYVIHFRNLKQALNNGLILKKVSRLINFNQKDWLKPYIEMNTDLRQRQKIILGKTFWS